MEKGKRRNKLALAYCLVISLPAPLATEGKNLRAEVRVGTIPPHCIISRNPQPLTGPHSITYVLPFDVQGINLIHTLSLH